VVFWGVPHLAKLPWLNSCLFPSPDTTGSEAGALTVAGQWRNFTAFPSILAIAVVNCAASRFRQPVSHGTDFHDINIYSVAGSQSQSPAAAIEPCLNRAPSSRQKALLSQFSSGASTQLYEW